METKSEGGHANNVAIAEKVLMLLTGWGERYTPPIASLSVTELGTAIAGARTQLSQIQAADTPYHVAVNSRNLIMEDIRRRVRASYLMVKVIATKEFLEEVKSLYKTISGQSKISRRSIESIISNFELLNERLKTLPEYAPTEETLTVASLTQLAADARTAEAEANQLEQNLRDARTERDRLLYTEKTGLVHRLRDVKNYVLASFGRQSQEYKDLLLLMRGVRARTVTA